MLVPPTSQNCISINCFIKQIAVLLALDLQKMFSLYFVKLKVHVSVFVRQCCDLGYHASLHRALRTYLSAEQNVESSKHSGLEALEGAAESLEANGDKQKVMETYNNIFCPPARFDFQSHMGDTVRLFIGFLSRWSF